jgi:glutathione synthase/RimK-type ligase-like ATP-grasp enzyme
MDAGVYDFCLRESRAALLGTLLGALPANARWLSQPTAVWVAEHKLFQLAIARDCGLTIPDTIVTNEAADARAAFARFGGRMIAKPVRTGYVEVDRIPHAIFTSEVSSWDLEDMQGADLSPVIYQPLVEKRCDIRVTVVGDRVFVAEIDSQSDPSALVDWRRTDDPHLPHRRGALPADVERQVRHFMRRIGLEYGALDFVATPEGELIFLEVNPNGQWLWLDDQLAFGITNAIADWLAPKAVGKSA